jgi:hypothetical protein
MRWRRTQPHTPFSRRFAFLTLVQIQCHIQGREHAPAGAAVLDVPRHTGAIYTASRLRATAAARCARSRLGSGVGVVMVLSCKRGGCLSKQYHFDIPAHYTARDKPFSLTYPFASATYSLCIIETGRRILANAVWYGLLNRQIWSPGIVRAPSMRGSRCRAPAVDAIMSATSNHNL